MSKVDYFFVCSANKLRSPTAEHVARRMGYTADSAGAVEQWAIRPLTIAAILRAKRIVCMEQFHLDIVAEHVKRELGRPAWLRLQPRTECWDIPDDYDYCQPELIKLIELRIGRPKAQREPRGEIVPESARILRIAPHDVNCQCPVCYGGAE